MNKVLLDTDILSEILKGKDPNVLSRARRYRAVYDSYPTTTITVMEIVKGFHRRGREDQAQQFLGHADELEVARDAHRPRDRAH